MTEAKQDCIFLIVYTFNKGGKPGCGSTFVTGNTPFPSARGLDRVQKDLIAQNGFDDCIILNVVRCSA